MRESDIVVDTLTFPITTGQEEVRRDALETIEAIRELKRRHPDVQTTLGVSNVSFGLNAAARQVLNSVFLHECVNAGLDTAIVSAAKILPMAKIPDEQRSVALDLVYDRAPRRATTRSTGSWSCSRASRRRRRRPGGPRSWRRCRCSSGWSGGSSTASALGLEADLDAALDVPARSGDHQRHAAGGHEDRRRAVRRRADAAAVRARVGRGDEGGRGPPRAAHGADRRGGQGHDRARHGQGRRARHRQEPRGHHPDQQRLHRGQPGHQAADLDDPDCRRPSTARTRSACPGCW